MKRRGFSLIELVFAIVVIAISLMTVPLMLNQGAKSNQFALMQESILAAHTKMGNILSFKWDENSGDNNDTIVRVLDVTAGDSQLDRKTAVRRVGHIHDDLRRRMQDSETNATSLGALGIEVADLYDDIDDFNGKSVIVAPVGAATQKGKFDYLDADLNLTTSVTYISDDVNYSQQDIAFDFNASDVITAGSSNIKMVELNATSVNSDIPFVFRMFSSNIGQSKLYERVK